MSQGQRVGQYIVAHLEAADPLTDRANHTTGRHAQCHWRFDPDIPTPRANDFIPVGCTRGSGLHYKLLPLWGLGGPPPPKFYLGPQPPAFRPPPSPFPAPPPP